MAVVAEAAAAVVAEAAVAEAVTTAAEAAVVAEAEAAVVAEAAEEVAVAVAEVAVAEVAAEAADPARTSARPGCPSGRSRPHDRRPVRREHGLQAARHPFSEAVSGVKEDSLPMPGAVFAAFPVP
ncbi:hypothetical protein ACFYY8_39740 [Streptosporangium sp. NPDC001559]|uniref:hypothetical protein n=1 Tax=Streptosporangium sp. NPDC001559 TaxID=3366187 RepID=UPI0036EAA1D0